MTHTYKDNYVVRGWTTKRFENNAPIKTDVFVYALLLASAVVFIICILCDIISGYINVGVIATDIFAILGLFILKMVRNKQIDWYLIGTIILLCILMLTARQMVLGEEFLQSVN